MPELDWLDCAGGRCSASAIEPEQRAGWKQVGDKWICPRCVERGADRWCHLQNRAMAEKLISGECLSVLDEGKTIGGGLYLLSRFVDDKDYCDPATESWIWSIGRNRSTGEIVASTGSGLYHDEDWECLFLR
jgi:hypothetical protein